MHKSWWENPNFSFNESLEWWENLCFKRLKDYVKLRNKVAPKWFLMHAFKIETEKIKNQRDMLPAVEALKRLGWRRVFINGSVSEGGKTWSGKYYIQPDDLKRWELRAKAYYKINRHVRRYLRVRQRVTMEGILDFLRRGAGECWGEAVELVLECAGWVRLGDGWVRKPRP